MPDGPPYEPDPPSIPPKPKPVPADIPEAEAPNATMLIYQADIVRLTNWLAAHEQRLEVLDGIHNPIEAAQEGS